MCEQKITEIDEQCQDPAIAVNSAKLNELGSERAVFLKNSKLCMSSGKCCQKIVKF